MENKRIWSNERIGQVPLHLLCIDFGDQQCVGRHITEVLPTRLRRQNSGGRTLLTFWQHTSNGNNASADTLPTYFRNPSDVLALEAHWPTLYRPITNNYNALAYIVLTHYRHPSYSPTNSVLVKTLPTYNDVPLIPKTRRLTLYRHNMDSFRLRSL